MGEVTQAERYAQSIMEHTERPCGTEEFREDFQEVEESVLGTKEKKGFSERKVINKGAGAREAEEQRRRDSSPQPVQGSLEKSKQVNTRDRQVDGVGHAAT